MSIAIPLKVLIRVIASAPAEVTACAISAVHSEPGDSFTITGSEVAFLTAAVTAEAVSGLRPNSKPPGLHVWIADIYLDTRNPADSVKAGSQLRVFINS